MSNRGYLPLILVGAAVLLFSMAAFTVRETELATEVPLRRDRALPTTSRACIS